VGEWSLTKAGLGTLSLAGNGNFTGGVIVNGGALNLVGDRGFNAGVFASGNAYTINAGGTVLLTGDWTTNGNADSFIINGGTLSTVNTYADPDGARQYINNVTMTGGLIAGQGIRLGNNGGTPTYTVNANAATAVISSPITLVNLNVTGPATFNVARGTAATDLVISGGIRDFNGYAGMPLEKTGPGIMTLSGTNTYTGGTIVEEGTLVATLSAAIPPGGSLAIEAGGTFVFDPTATGAPVASPAASAGVTAVPEPGTLVLLAAGLAVFLAAAARRRRSLLA